MRLQKRYYGDDFLKLPCSQYKSAPDESILYYLKAIDLITLAYD